MDDTEQQNKRKNVDLFKKLQDWIFLLISIYASIVGIISFNDDIKKLMSTPTKIDELKSTQDGIKNELSFIKKECANQNISGIKSDQEEIKTNIEKITQKATVSHANIIDEEGFVKIKVRRADKESNQGGDKTSVYYDMKSSFFQELKQDAEFKKYKVIFKSIETEYDPTIIVEIRKTNNSNSNSETDIAFQVSQAIFTTLGGTDKNSLLTVRAKLIEKNYPD